MWINLTLPEASKRAARSPADARFGAALLASAVIHLTTLAVLGDAIGGAHHGAFTWSAAIDRPLEVAISPPRIIVETETRSVASENASAALHIATPKESVPEAPVIARRQPATEPLADPGSVGRGLTPLVTVNDQIPLGRFGEALDDTLGEFPVEIDAAVTLPGKLEVPYPPAALAAHREDRVLVWAVIDPEGAVEQAHVVEGTPEFAAAVEAALSTMHFIPAHDLGRNIRFYVTLEFEFRIEGANAPGTTATATEPR